MLPEPSIRVLDSQIKRRNTSIVGMKIPLTDEPSIAAGAQMI
jgi:hypothetical protein